MAIDEDALKRHIETLLQADRLIRTVPTEVLLNYYTLNMRLLVINQGDEITAGKFDLSANRVQLALSSAAQAWADNVKPVEGLIYGFENEETHEDPFFEEGNGGETGPPENLGQAKENRTVYAKAETGGEPAENTSVDTFGRRRSGNFSGAIQSGVSVEDQ